MEPTAGRADPLVESPWKRYGHDRVYLKTADGHQVGWVDLKTGVESLSDPHHKAQFDVAIDRLAQLHPAVRPELITDAAAQATVSARIPAARSHEQAPAPISPAVMPATPSQDVLPGAYLRPTTLLAGDLSRNKPGEAARLKARELRDEAPVRTLVARVLGVKTEERNWRVGADGEEAVGRELTRLTECGWHVLHAIPVGDRGSDIDHVVIGPGGVFTVNTKHHKGARIWVKGDTIKVNGFSQTYVRNSRHEASRAAKMLARDCGFIPPVTGLLVMVNADKFDVALQPRDVGVTYRKNVFNWLLAQPTMLRPSHVQTIFEAARKPESWRPLPKSR